MAATRDSEESTRQPGTIALADPTPGRTDSGAEYITCTLVVVSSTDRVLVAAHGGTQRFGDLRSLPIVSRMPKRSPKAMRQAALVLARATRRQLISREVAEAPARPTATVVRRPRERRPTGGRGARSPGCVDSDSDRPPRLCGCGCGTAVPASRRGYVDDSHSNRARQQRHRRTRDRILRRYHQEVEKARRRGELSDDEAFELRVCPSELVLGRLAEEVAA